MKITSTMYMSEEERTALLHQALRRAVGYSVDWCHRVAQRVSRGGRYAL